MKVKAVIQARMGSSRLPGKVLKHLQNQPLLAYLIRRVKKSLELDGFSIATSQNSKDEAIEDFCNRNSVPVFRGSEEDVLSRFYHLANTGNFSHIVRITADCPLLDFRILDQMIEFYRKNDLDFLSNTFQRTFPDGQDLAIFSFNSLEKAYKNAESTYDREHVTSYMKRFSTVNNQDKFNAENYSFPYDFSHLRMTVDYQKDIEVVRYLANYCSISASWLKYVSVLTKKPELLKKNRQHVNDKFL